MSDNGRFAEAELGVLQRCEHGCLGHQSSIQREGHLLLRQWWNIWLEKRYQGRKLRQELRLTTQSGLRAEARRLQVGTPAPQAEALVSADIDHGGNEGGRHCGGDKPFTEVHWDKRAGQRTRGEVGSLKREKEALNTQGIAAIVGLAPVVQVCPAAWGKNALPGKSPYLRSRAAGVYHGRTDSRSGRHGSNVTAGTAGHEKV